MGKLIIKNAKIVNEDNIFKGCLVVNNGIIEEISDSVDESGAMQIINAEGLYLFPGVIDDQVHFREPGLTHKADIYTESAAAAAGGVTSYMEMPNSIPQATNLIELEKKYQTASEKSVVNYSFYLGATNDNIDEIKKITPSDVCGVKVFMGSSTGNMLVDKEYSLQKIFAESPILIATHCEDEETIKSNTLLYKQKMGEDIPFSYHPIIRSAEACYKSSSFAAELASKYDSQLHILHLSSAKELGLLDANPNVSEKKITGEVCVHHLWFNSDDYSKFGSRIKWNPAIKAPEDQDALFMGLLNNKLDVVATDHAPHTIEEKNNSYFKAPSGGPLVQHSLVAMLEFYKKGKITLEKIARKMCHAPADLFRIKQRGYIRTGYHADLVLVDLNKKWEVSTNNILYKCKWSPFEGTVFNSSVIYTIVNGEVVFNEGRILEKAGQRLKFNR